jgi:hypothetical protein
MNNQLNYLRSFALELTAQANRVRNLIGDRHWLSDGTHKEHLLASLLQRHLPATTLLAKGFVADLQQPALCSMEQDLLVLDTSFEGPLFHQGGLVVASPDSVIATVSVKSTLRADSLRDTIVNQNSVRQIVQTTAPNRDVFCGGYFFCASSDFDHNGPKLYRTYEASCADAICPMPIGEVVPANPIGPDMICCGGSLALKAIGTASGNTCSAVVRGYDCDGVAAAVLIASILEAVAHYRGKSGSELSILLENAAMKPLDPPAHEFRAKMR